MTEDKAIASHVPVGRRVSRVFGQYIIKNRFQFKFSFIIFLFLSIASFTIWFEGQWAVSRMVSAGLVESEAAAKHLEYLNQLIAYTGCLSVAITFFLSLFFSHYVAGPVYRFEKTLEEMKNGNLTMFVKLRKRDEFKDTAEVFNQALASLRIRIQKDRDGIEKSIVKFTALSQKLKQEGRTQDANELDQLIFDLKNTPSHLKI